MELTTLITQANNGDENAFAEICQRFEGLVCKHARQKHMHPISEDAHAYGRLAIVEAVRTYNPASRVHPAAYIESKVKFSLWNLFKRERRRWQTEVIATQEESDDKDFSILAKIPSPHNTAAEIEQAETSAELSRALQAMPERQRQAIILTILQEQTLQTAAEQMGVSLQAVYSLRKRGVKAMHSIMLKYN